MKQISIKEQKAGLSTEPEARLHQNLQMKCKTPDLAILLPRNYLPPHDQYYNTHGDGYFYLNLHLTRWELQTLSHTNSHISRRVKMGKKELEAFQVLSYFSPFSLNHTKTIWGNNSELICATPDLISKAKYSRITGRGFVHALSQILVVMSVLSSLCPSFSASKASLKIPLKSLDKCLNFQDLFSIALSKSDRK